MGLESVLKQRYKKNTITIWLQLAPALHVDISQQGEDHLFCRAGFFLNYKNMRLKIRVDICKAWGFFKHAAYLEGRIYSRFPELKLNFNVTTDKYISGRFDIWVYSNGEWKLIYQKLPEAEMPSASTVEGIIEELSGFIKWGEWYLSGKFRAR